eukprot:m.124524 g.124524  ORF g.124524 m.124524 type:complete len:53 (-) comp9425_c10_seq1:84-242(-)
MVIMGERSVVINFLPKTLLISPLFQKKKILALAVNKFVSDVNLFLVPVGDYE